MANLLDNLSRSLIVSCQPVTGGPLDTSAIVARLALAALAGGARGLRIEGIVNVKAVRAVTDVPVIGLVKRDLADFPVRITPFVEDAEQLAKAGADIIAFDATQRERPVSANQLCEAAHRAGKLAMADISNVAEARAAVQFGVDVIGTTLSGYTGDITPEEPDLELVRQIVSLGKPAIAEGRIRTPEHAALALQAGAFAVVVGSAITRPEYITEWFVKAMA
jgi:N-acetylmannosamine-6-phosphate 2-epimerase / N-acetylmannosamine kinase